LKLRQATYSLGTSHLPLRHTEQRFLIAVVALNLPALDALLSKLARNRPWPC
jgi:hypothetical protein